MSDRALVQQYLNTVDYASHGEIEQATGLGYHACNRALNAAPNPVLGETPFARTENPGVGPQWVYYAVTPTNPLTQHDFGIKTKTAMTQLTKAQENLLAPAIRAGAVANGDSDDLAASLTYLDASIKALDQARKTGDVKAEGIRVANQANAALALANEKAAEAAELMAKAQKVQAEAEAMKRALTKTKIGHSGPKK